MFNQVKSSLRIWMLVVRAGEERKKEEEGAGWEMCMWVLMLRGGLIASSESVTRDV